MQQHVAHKNPNNGEPGVPPTGDKSPKRRSLAPRLAQMKRLRIITPGKFDNLFFQKRMTAQLRHRSNFEILIAERHPRSPFQSVDYLNPGAGESRQRRKRCEMMTDIA